MEEALADYVEKNCLYTLAQMQEMLRFDFEVQLSSSLISKKLCGRSRIGERAVVKLPPWKGAKLQLQCGVSPEVGLVHWAKRRGSIKMDVNASFVDDVYDAVKALDVYKEHFMGKTIVIVLDNAPVHSQTDQLVIDREDLELLRLAPYTPMCNPIEGCFSVLKSKIKAHLAMNTHEMFNLPYGAADRGMSSIDLHLVNKMARHCAFSIAAAIRSEPCRMVLSCFTLNPHWFGLNLEIFYSLKITYF
ncbi:hypothetical protein PHMEG_0008622 [Phytophthora megakarya]|uniref:Tc1-like transposase DDE domain-containing protein n=1 Tax=Phytophthora megakarya TaxID=4795 RepID=A0A225WIN8_9STRA|nr:hypothetical protein PHMEG_0008622 [Phytophthora megakarya]